MFRDGNNNSGYITRNTVIIFILIIKYQFVMKELKVKLNEKDFNLTINDDGLILPNSSDILNYAGLKQLTKKSDL